MKCSQRVMHVGMTILLLVTLCGFTAVHEDAADIPVVVTATPQYKPLAALDSGERFPPGAHLVLVQNGDSRSLLPDFFASADANVSFDGKALLFAGKRTSADRWQIWELNLSDHAVRRIIDSPTDAIRPMYLPGGRLIFSRRTKRGNFSLIAADLDGKHELQLTYLPASAIPTDILADGRILFESHYPLGAGTTPELFLVYSDGSGVESYRCDHVVGRARWGGHQIAEGDVVFTHGQSLARFASAFAEEKKIVVPTLDYTGDVVEDKSGGWLLSARSNAGGHYSLRKWAPGKLDARSGAAGMIILFSRKGEDIVQPVLLAPRNRPHQHPSALHDWEYANLLALDAKQSRDGEISESPRLIRLEARDENGAPLLLGTAPIEPDGSFFVKVPADRSIRFSLLDGKGALIKQEQGWFWIRRGEQRVCVGCHTGPERAAENRVPAVLLRSTDPNDLSLIHKSATGRPDPQGGR